MSKHPISSMGIMVTIFTGLVFIVVLILPPWASPDRGPYTKLNLGDRVSANYHRTVNALVWKEGHIDPAWQPRDSSFRENGDTAYVIYGCASCHGIDAQGSAAAGSVTGFDANIIRYFVRNGPGGMPAFSEEGLPDDNLNAIIGWLTTIDTTKKLPPLITHGLINLSDCLSCHSQGKVWPFPEDHVNRTIDVCLVCHAR